MECDVEAKKMVQRQSNVMSSQRYRAQKLVSQQFASLVLRRQTQRLQYITYTLCSQRQKYRHSLKMSSQVKFAFNKKQWCQLLQQSPTGVQEDVHYLQHMISQYFIRKTRLIVNCICWACSQAVAFWQLQSTPNSLLAGDPACTPLGYYRMLPKTPQFTGVGSRPPTFLPYAAFGVLPPITKSWLYTYTHTYSLFQFGSHRLDSHNIHKIKSENLD